MSRSSDRPAFDGRGDGESHGAPQPPTSAPKPPGKARPVKRAFRLDRRSRDDARAAVDDELRHHLDLCVEELVAAGWPAEEARREAERRFGDLDETRAYCEDVQTRRGREEGRSMWWDELARDLGYALRCIRRAPGYAGLVIVTIAFGIAANTTTFSVVNPYLFRPLPFGEAHALVQVNQVNPVTGWDMDRFSYPQYVDWRERSRAFDELAAYSYGSANVTDQEGPEQLQLARLTPNMFDVLRVTPALGRTFRTDDATPGAEPVVVLSHGLWQRRYTADSRVVGRTITLDGVQHTVVGVMRPEFVFPFGSARLWTAIQDEPAADRGRLPYLLVGRLADGWTIDRARGELIGIQAELSALHPETDGRMDGVTVKPLREALNFVWDIVTALFAVLLGAMGFVLLIACVNVASLTLVRGSGRRRELAVRAALGAGRARIVRQLLTEGVVLALLAGTLGVAISYLIAGSLDGVIPEDLFKVGGISIDGAVLSFSLVATLLTPIGFALVPALRASRADPGPGLKEGSKGSGGLATSRGRRILVVTQIALAVVLISGAGLMLRSFGAVRSLDLGFEPSRVATVEVVLPAAEFPSAERRRAFMTAAVETVRAVPGVETASAVAWLPLNHETLTAQVAPSEMAGAPASEWSLAVRNLAYPGYFEAMGIGLLAGRALGAADDGGGAPVAVVSESLAARLWPGVSAVGRTLLVDGPTEPRAVTVVGVAEDVRHQDLDRSDGGLQIYEPALQASVRRIFVVARASGDPADLFPPLRDAMRAVAPTVPATVRTMDDVVAENHLQWSLASVFLGVFGAGALLLATLGIYGLVSFSVAQRNREIGVRIALGATRGAIRSSVVGDGLRLAAMGILIGLVAALGLARLAASVLYGVGAADPVTLAVVAVLFAAVAGLASFVPAARASTTSPSAVLRAE